MGTYTDPSCFRLTNPPSGALSKFSFAGHFAGTELVSGSDVVVMPSFSVVV